MAAIYEIYENMQRDHYYPLRDGVRGKALIIDIVNFPAPSGDSTVRQLEKREGAEKDGEKMEKLFQDLGFETEVHVDVNRHRLEGILKIYKSMDHSNYDAFIFCIMTHGKLGEIYTSDCLPYRMLDIVDMFSSTNCLSLRGKPKLFFVQSCQNGARRDSSESSTNRHGFTSDSATSSALEPDADKCSVGDTDVGEINENTEGECPDATASCLSPGLFPRDPDILMSYAALPGSVSYRDINSGSLYIDALADNLRKDLEIDRALKKVSQEVDGKLQEYGRELQINYKPQIPIHLATGMTKLLYLKKH